MKCKECKKGRPKLWTSEGGFCDHYCLNKYRQRKKDMAKVRQMVEDARAKGELPKLP